MPLPDGWSSINNFTTIFGTALNGSEITWYNDSSADSGVADRDQLKIYWVQNLFSSLYTYYDSDTSSNAEDNNYFNGNWDITTQTGAFTFTDDVTGASDVPQSDYHTGSILFHMQIKNPVSTATPEYDGFWTLA